MRRSFAGMLLCSLVISSVLGACGTNNVEEAGPTSTPRPGTPDVRPRSFEMGLSSLPPELDEASYEQTFALIGRAGDVVLIQRSPPWAELLGGDLSEATAAQSEREVELAEEHGLEVFFAIDPTDPATGRTDLVDLPDELAAGRFGDEQVREALLRYARYVATNYRPRYLAFGVEINSYQRAQPQDFEQFVTLYGQAYREVKEISPDTLMFPTFQLEDMNGYLSPAEPQPPQWFLLNRFGPALDLLAVSSYPRSAFQSVDNLPPDHFEHLEEYDLPIALVGTGYPSGPPPDGGTEALQATYMIRVLDQAQRSRMRLVVWFLSQDITTASGPPFDRLQFLGLRRQDGTPKQAWEIWETVALRPVTRTGAEN